MGRMLGAFDGDNELDRPDLNKCPDCGCYFAQETCPLCGKICPEEFRAGNRKTVRTPRWKKNKSGYTTRNVIFVEWYHRLWFILLMLILMPIVGIILLATSPHKRYLKIMLIVVGLLYTGVSVYGFDNLQNLIYYRFEETVNTSLSEEAYLERCQEVRPDDFNRNPGVYEDEYVYMTLYIRHTFIDYDADRYHGKHTTYYVCSDPNQPNSTFLVRDCRDDGPRFRWGDYITVYGEGAGLKEIYAIDAGKIKAPCLYMAYAVLNPPS